MRALWDVESCFESTGIQIDVRPSGEIADRPPAIEREGQYTRSKEGETQLTKASDSQYKLSEIEFKLQRDG